jgi:hypothetical protein
VGDAVMLLWLEYRGFYKVLAGIINHALTLLGIAYIFLTLKCPTDILFLVHIDSPA